MHLLQTGYDPKKELYAVKPETFEIVETFSDLNYAGPLKEYVFATVECVQVSTVRSRTYISEGLLRILVHNTTQANFSNFMSLDKSSRIFFMKNFRWDGTYIDCDRKTSFSEMFEVVEKLDEILERIPGSPVEYFGWLEVLS